MKKSLKALAASGIVMMLMLSTIAHAQAPDPNEDLIMVTGEHWTNASRSGKLGYLMGIGNFLEVEQAMHEDSTPADDESLVPVLTRGLKNYTVADVLRLLDRWYTDNPSQLKRPVLEVIYMEIAKPRS